ncbi:hypothetical protein PI125_g21452 [Phytophthora idaei]|nr:hypothetical protein PI125_g21452 [Phytophthora idaei]
MILNLSNDCSSEFTIDFISSDEDSDELTVAERFEFTPLDTYASLEEEKRGIDSVDGYAYTLFYNYGEGSGNFCLKEEGVHTGTITNKKKRGIPWYFMQKYESVPSESQLKNRNATLRKQSSGGWEIKNVAELVEWTPAHLCTTRGELFLRGLGSIVDSRAAQPRRYFGTYTTYYDKKQYAKTFVPRAYMFVRTEHQVVYATMFTTSIHRQRLHINCVFSHQEAFEMIMWPQEKAEYAQWFEDTYLASPWASWYYQGATPGVTPSQNALEFHYKTIKTTILFHDALKAFRGKLNHFSEGPLCSGAVGRAKQLLDNKKNYYTLKAPKPRAVFGVLFDGTKFLISCSNINGSAPTRGRAQPYLKSLGGMLPADITVLNVERCCLSIHQVKFLHVNCLAKFTPSAWILSIPGKYVCDCVFFVKTGWQSSYALAAMVLQDEVNMSGLLKSLPTIKASGGQRKAKSCHTKDRSDHSQFSVAGLVKLYLATPMAPIHWNVMRGFEVNKKGVLTNESFLGTVISWGNNDGVYCWTVTFTKAKKTVMLECQN